MPLQWHLHLQQQRGGREGGAGQHLHLQVTLGAASAGQVARNFTFKLLKKLSQRLRAKQLSAQFEGNSWQETGARRGQQEGGSCSLGQLQLSANESLVTRSPSWSRRAVAKNLVCRQVAAAFYCLSPLLYLSFTLSLSLLFSLFSLF